MVADGMTRPRSPLIGRQRELGLLWDLYQTVTHGRTNVALVAGEPGIGKTRLLEEMAMRVAAAGATVLHGGASQEEGMPPYLPFLEALGGFVRAAPRDQLRDQAGFGVTALASILPEVTTRLGQIPAAYQLPPEQARLRLYEAVGSFLAAIAASHSLLLILDDLQWADDASLDLLCHVTRQQPAARLLILGAYRGGELPQNPAFERALAEMTRQRMLTTETLGPLGVNDVAALANNYLDGETDPQVSQLLHTHSEGNPFFAEELLRGWLETGVLQSEARRWTLVAPLRSNLPPSIVAAIRQRLSRLPPETVDQLRIASIIGRIFDARLLALVQNRDVEPVEERLLAATRALLIHDDGAGIYTFTHDKIRECLSTEVSSTRRQRLHKAIGLALEAGSDQKTAQQLADLAFHFARSGDRARGAEYSMRAAGQALHAYAPEAAIAQYRTALDLIDPDDRRRGELLLGLGQAALLTGAYQESAESYVAAQTWFGRLGSTVNRARAGRGSGLSLWRQDELAAAQSALEQALTWLEATNQPEPEAVRTLVDLANLLGVTLGRQTEGISYGERALALARQLGSSRLEAAASRTLGFLLVVQNDIPTGVRHLEQALALADADDDPVEAAECCSYLAQSYCWSADFERVRQVSTRRTEFARRCQQPFHLCNGFTWLAFAAAVQGSWSQAHELSAMAQQAGEHAPSGGSPPFLRQIRGFIAYQQGDYSLAEREYQSAVTIFRAKDPVEFALCLGPLGLALLASGRRQAARACLSEQEAILAKLSAGKLLNASVLGCMALTALTLGDHERAATYYSRLLACEGQYHWFLVDRILGAIAMSRSDCAAAATHLAAAEATARLQDLRPELGRILKEQAELEIVRGGMGSATRARSHLGQALALFQELNMEGEANNVRERLHRLPRQPGRARRWLFPLG